MLNEQLFEIIPSLLTMIIILFIMLGTLFLAAKRAVKAGHLPQAKIKSLVVLASVIIPWGILSSFLSINGFYLSEKFLSLMPGLWLPLVPAVLVVALVLVSSDLRDVLRAVIDHTPSTWFIYIHAMRITAIGTLIKTFQGKFPISFELGVGVPDLFFGISALWLAAMVKRGSFNDKHILWWNIIGAAVILIPGGILFQMGLPGPMQMFTQTPTAEVMMLFPLVLAPTLLVPLFVLFNILVAWRLLEQRKGS